MPDPVVTPDATAKAEPEVTPAEQKPAEGAAVEPVFDLKLPDGSKLDPSRIEALKSWAKDKKVAPEIAQEVLTREHDALATYESAQAASYEKQKESWLNELKADKEYGGDNLAKNSELAQRFLKKFAPEGFSDVLNTTGLGNNPLLFKTLVNFAKSVSEDSLVLSNQTSSGPKDLRDVFYPKKQE